MEGYYEHYGVGDYSDDKLSRLKKAEKPNENNVQKTRPNVQYATPAKKANIESDKNAIESLAKLFQSKKEDNLRQLDEHHVSMREFVPVLQKFREMDININLRLLTLNEKNSLNAISKLMRKPLFLISISGADHIVIPGSTGYIALSNISVNIEKPTRQCMDVFHSSKQEIFHLFTRSSLESLHERILNIAASQTALEEFGNIYAIEKNASTPIKRPAIKVHHLKSTGSKP